MQVRFHDLSLMTTASRLFAPAGARPEAVGAKQVLSGQSPDGRAERAIAKIISILMQRDGASGTAGTNFDMRYRGPGQVGATAGDGDDSISIEAQRAVSVNGGAGDDVISIRASGGFERQAASVRGSIMRNDIQTVEGGAGRDRITLSATDGIDGVYGGDGDDTISTSSFRAYAIDGGAGNDRITVRADQIASGIDGGDGDDIITIVAPQVSGVTGGNGNDTVSISAEVVKASLGGKGDDRLSLNIIGGRAALVTTAEGDGHDTVDTNAALFLRRYSEDGTRNVSDAAVTTTRNSDGSFRLTFAGSNDSVTLRFTGELTGHDLVVEHDAREGWLVIRSASQPARAWTDETAKVTNIFANAQDASRRSFTG